LHTDCRSCHAALSGREGSSSLVICAVEVSVRNLCLALSYLGHGFQVISIYAPRDAVRFSDLPEVEADRRRWAGVTIEMGRDDSRARIFGWPGDAESLVMKVEIFESV
jgi:hypothetical protein